MFFMIANWGLSSRKSPSSMSVLHISSTLRQTAVMLSVWSSWTSFTFESASLGVLSHDRVGHPIKLRHLSVCNNPLYRSYHQTTLLGYQVTLEIVKYHIQVSAADAGRSRLIGRSQNNLQVAKLPHHSLGKTRIHQTWPTFHPSRV